MSCYLFQELQEMIEMQSRNAQLLDVSKLLLSKAESCKIPVNMESLTVFTEVLEKWCV